MKFPLLPLVTSCGALLFEFSLAQYLAMALGNSAFGYSFVVGSFLLAMGIGSWLSERFGKGEEAARLLVRIELALVALCLSALPLLAWLTGALKGWSFTSETCRALICEAPGVSLAFAVLFLLIFAGICVGAEIPLFLRAFGGKLGGILAADYTGAFVAGLLFPFFTLPYLGLVGTLGVAGLCHGVAAFAISWRSGRSLRARFAAVLGVLLACFVLAASEGIERRLLLWITASASAQETKVLTYFRTHKQSVLLVEDVLRDGQRDRRLYLDGYLQSSSLWNESAYHEGLVLPARRQLGAAPAKVLILGGGDGLAAQMVLRHFPKDEIHIVDFDGELLARAAKDPALTALAPLVWSSANVSVLAADAFWYLRRSPASWDLILVDFPHGVGDAAAAKVETWEFFRDLAANLSGRGLVVLHHEKYGSEAQACVQATLASAGFDVESSPMEEAGSPEAILIGKRNPALSARPKGQNWFRLRCQGLKGLASIWLGA